MSKNRKRQSRRRLLNRTSRTKATAAALVAGRKKGGPKKLDLNNAAHRRLFEELILPILKNPYLKILGKMAESTGLLKPQGEIREIIFVPEAVMYYGFAHLPTKSDPEGRMVSLLPERPDPNHLQHGAYLFLPRAGQDETRLARPENDLHFSQAQDIYADSGQKGIAPQIVLDVLLMHSNMTRIWLAIDPDDNLDIQFRALKKWLSSTKRSLFNRKGKTLHTAREAPRDTLIFTLKESAGWSVQDIAVNVFDKEYEETHLDPLDAERLRKAGHPLENRVNQSLLNTRKALKSIGLYPPKK